MTTRSSILVTIGALAVGLSHFAPAPARADEWLRASDSVALDKASRYPDDSVSQVVKMPDGTQRVVISAP